MRKSNLTLSGLSVLGFTLLAGCAAEVTEPKTLTPVAARLSSDMLVVTLNDGQTCVSQRPETGDWVGQFADCGPGITYRVVPDPKQNPLRVVFERGMVLAGIGDSVVPLARVDVTDTTGRVVEFALPEPFEH
jgi:hypothetical protein